MLFRRESDYLHFLQIYKKWVHPLLQTYAWSLTPEQASILAGYNPGQRQNTEQADKLIKRYCRYNRKYNKNRASMVKKVIHLPQPDKERLRNMVIRVHCLPLLDGLGNNFVEYPWTSYLMLMGPNPTWLKTDEVMGWFGGKAEFREAHHRTLDKKLNTNKPESENFINFRVRK